MGGALVRNIVPENIKRQIEGYSWTENLDGQSGSSVYRLQSETNAPDLFLKWGSGPAAREIEGELAKLHWLSRYTSVPQVVASAHTESEFWLLMTAIEGQTAYTALQSKGGMQSNLVAALARHLKNLHAIPTDQCPFDNSHRLRMAHARRRIDEGLVDTDDFDDERQGWTPEQIWAAINEKLPLLDDSVVTHGDFSLDNILIEHGEVVGCIDVGRCGLADRYQDIAILWNCLGEFSLDLQTTMLKEYGIKQVDQDKLEFHLLMDELF